MALSAWGKLIAATVDRASPREQARRTAPLPGSMALAATAPPPEGAMDVIRAAARHGADALGRLVSIPLPLLADIEVFLRSLSPGVVPLRPLKAPTAESMAYEEWLRRFVVRAVAHLRIPPYRGRGGGGNIDLTFLLAEQFAVPAPQPDLRAAFQNLADAGELHDALGAWEGPRSVAAWRSWYPKPLGPFTPRNTADGILAQCAAATGSGWVIERCNHDAARYYLDAVDITARPDQQRRVQRLTRRQRVVEPNPLSASHEEQALYYGAITAATLAGGRYGEFKIAQRSDLRIVERPPTSPPPPSKIHLCWGHGGKAIVRTLSAPAFGKMEVELGRLMTEASVLQGLAALILDDWRSGLESVKVRFFAHRGPPREGVDDLGPPGVRWKPSKPERPLPPAEFVGRFFQRADWRSLDGCGLSWREAPSSDAWWCLMLLNSELDDFGLHPPEDEQLRAQGVLVAASDALPAAISVVITLDPATWAGTIYGVTRNKVQRSLRLSRLPPRPSAQGKDPSFRGLRLQAFDVLLDALEGANR